ncbi:MAG: hypothetical protein SGJ26_03685 [Nitrospirota bacterium]|nr:hypothetical protein [Nitrospirota bacterium]
MNYARSYERFLPSAAWPKMVGGKIAQMYLCLLLTVASLAERRNEGDWRDKREGFEVQGSRFAELPVTPV